MKKLLIGVSCPPNLIAFNIIRFFVDALNIRHVIAHRTTLDLHTDLMLWNQQKTINTLFNGLIVSNITTDEDAEYLRNKGAIILHIRHQNSLLKTGVELKNNDLCITKDEISMPSNAALNGIIAAITERVYQDQTEAA